MTPMGQADVEEEGKKFQVHIQKGGRKGGREGGREGGGRGGGGERGGGEGQVLAR